MSQTIQQALQQSALLDDVSETARLDVTALLAHVLVKDRAYLYTWPDEVLSEDQETTFRTLLQRRLAGEPIAYLIGQREFWSLPLRVTPDTLIPRPETELLVEFALEQFSPAEKVRLLDLGTGTGAIALAVAAERPEWVVTGLDNSAEALQIARDNGAALGLDQVELLHSDWYQAIADRKFDLIVSNPPYVEAGDVHLEQGDVRFEPREALVSGADGLNALRVIISKAPEYLAARGWLAVEHGFQQGSAVRGLLEQAGFSMIETRQDLSGLDRMTCGLKK